MCIKSKKHLIHLIFKFKNCVLNWKASNTYPGFAKTCLYKMFFVQIWEFSRDLKMEWYTSKSNCICDWVCLFQNFTRGRLRVWEGVFAMLLRQCWGSDLGMCLTVSQIMTKFTWLLRDIWACVLQLRGGQSELVKSRLAIVTCITHACTYNFCRTEHWFLLYKVVDNHLWHEQQSNSCYTFMCSDIGAKNAPILDSRNMAYLCTVTFCD